MASAISGRMDSQDLTPSGAYQPPAQAGTGAVPITDSQLAGFWRRLGAYLVDGIVLGVIGLVLSLVFGAILGSQSGQTVSSVLGILIGVAYFGYFWSSRGQT